MTLKDFLKVFDFDDPDVNYPRTLEICTLECLAGSYHSKSEIEKDFCIALYDVIEIRPVDHTVLQIVIAH